MSEQEQKRKKRKKKKNNKRAYQVLCTVFLIGFAVICGILVNNQMTKKNAQNLQDKLAEEVNDINIDKDNEEDTSGIRIPEKNLDWDKLREENEDIYAWIFVPGTGIDYPVVQHPTDDIYYLDHNLDGTKGYPGTIFTQSVNSKDFSDFNTVLYGHDMNDGSMFASLHNFEDREFFEKNRYIYIYTEEGNYAYEIFGAYEFPDTHLLYQYDLSTEKGIDEYLGDVHSVRDMNAHFDESIAVTTDSHIITLSTCIDAKPTYRYLVQGAKVEE